MHNMHRTVFLLILVVFFQDVCRADSSAASDNTPTNLFFKPGTETKISTTPTSNIYSQSSYSYEDRNRLSEIVQTLAGLNIGSSAKGKQNQILFDFNEKFVNSLLKELAEISENTTGICPATEIQNIGQRPTNIQTPLDGPKVQLHSNWWQYPFPNDIVMLMKSQSELQNNNLIDSYTEQNDTIVEDCMDPKIGHYGRALKTCSRSLNKYRRLDGQCNDLENPAAGSLYYRFGRNVPLNATTRDDCNLFKPNPRDISRELLERKQFIPVKSINILIAGWIQFMIHDWFYSGANDNRRKIKVSVRDNDKDFKDTIDIPMTKPDMCTKTPGLTKTNCKRLGGIHCSGRKKYETFQNGVTHWWDASQLYGSDVTVNNKVRTHVDGKLVLTKEGRLPIDPNTAIPITGLSINWWVGLEMFHIIWTKEHNHICNILKHQNPNWDDDTLFNTARLIVSAVIAKIHVLEWTTAILQNELVHLGLKSNWYGTTLEEFTRGNKSLASMLAKNHPELSNGIPGTVGRPMNIRGVPYSLTEDFIAVYRLHPLLPDRFVVRDHRTNTTESVYDMVDAVFEKSQNVLDENSMENLFYSFGTDYPGAMTLHNYPQFLRNLNLSREHPSYSEKVDLATIDIVRDRERGIPRYNEFRRLLHLTPVSSFEQLTTNKKHATELRRVYNDDIESVDLLIGSLAESPLPEGFGFSDTFFRIFLVMARRRLEADRFFTDHYTPELYTQWGLDYIDQTYMKDILMRHYPSLTPVLKNIKNTFIPWQSQTV